MHDAVFMTSFGSNIYETLGALQSLDSDIRNTSIYNVMGSSSLIIFLKILGFTYSQMFDLLEKFELSHTFINGYFLIPEDQEIKKNHIRNWLLEKIEINNLINEDSTLEEIFKLTKIFPNFIVWSRKEAEFVSLNPKNFSNLTLVDCVLATLPSIGTFTEHCIDDNVFSNYSSGDMYPYNLAFNLENKNLNTLFIVHQSRYFFHDLSNIESPFSLYENEIISQFIESNNNLTNKLKLENKLIIYNDIYKTSFNSSKRLFCFDNGKQQGLNFTLGDCNLTYYTSKKEEIKNQK
mgnify:CR=1 FL=1